MLAGVGALLVLAVRRRARRARAARHRARPGDRRRRPAARLARARRERPRPLAAARPPGRRARRQPADARQPARRADQEPGRHRRHARRAASGLTALALSPDGRTLAAGDAAGNVFLFDTRTRRRVTAPDVHPGDWAIVQLAYSPDGRRLAIAHDSDDGDVVTLMDTRTRSRRAAARALRLRRGRSPGCAFRATRHVDVASRPGGDRGAPQPTRGAVRRRQRAAGPRSASRSGAGRARRCSGSSDGRRVLTVADEQLVVRDAATLKPVERASPSACTGSVIALSPDDRTVAVGGQRRLRALRRPAHRPRCARHRAGIGGPVTGRALHAGRPLAGHDERRRRRDPVGRAAPARRPRRCTGTPTGSRRCRSPATAGRSTRPGSTARSSRGTSPARAGSAARSTPAPPNRTVAALSPDGRRLALGHQNGAVTVVDLDRPGSAPDVRRRPRARRRDRHPLRARQPARGRHGSSDEFIALVDTDTGRTVRTRPPRRRQRQLRALHPRRERRRPPARHAAEPAQGNLI